MRTPFSVKYFMSLKGKWYDNVHAWIRYHYGKPQKCDVCGTTDSSKRYEWSSIDHKYKKDRSFFQRLCSSCHKKHEYSRLNLRKKRDKLKGRWSLLHDSCVVCHSTEREYKSQGLCGLCYNRSEERRTYKRLWMRAKRKRIALCRQ